MAGLDDALAERSRAPTTRSVTATLRVSDGINPPVLQHGDDHSSPTRPRWSPRPCRRPRSVPVGTAVSVGLNFGDAGTNDTHTATINWGDSTTSTATVTEVDGSGSVTDSHVYTASGNYHVTVTVTDDDGASASSSTDIAANGAPTVGVGGPYSGVEGAGRDPQRHRDRPRRRPPRRSRGPARSSPPVRARPARSPTRRP